MHLHTPHVCSFLPTGIIVHRFWYASTAPYVTGPRLTYFNQAIDGRILHSLFDSDFPSASVNHPAVVTAAVGVMSY